MGEQKVSAEWIRNHFRAAGRIAAEIETYALKRNLWPLDLAQRFDSKEWQLFSRLARAKAGQMPKPNCLPSEETRTFALEILRDHEHEGDLPDGPTRPLRAQ